MVAPERPAERRAEGNGGAAAVRVHQVVLDGRPVATDVLDAAERERHRRLRRQPDRDRFAAGATLLRIAAGTAFGLDPAEVEVVRTCDGCGLPHGRPKVAGSPVHCSVAHAGRHVLVALSSTGPVGVDIEDVDRGLGDTRHRILPHLSAPGEDDPDADGGWLARWVRKEALLKLSGEGLRRPMTTLRVRRLTLDTFDIVDPPTPLVDAVVQDIIVDGAIAAVATYGAATVSLLRAT